MKIFVLTKKKQRHFGPFFGPKFGHFRSKIRFLVIFFETAHQICLKFGQKLGTIALNHRMAVLCLGNYFFRHFGLFGSKIHCMWWHLYGFGLFFVIFFRTFDVLVNLCYLNFVYGLGMINEKDLFFLFGRRWETSALRACLYGNYPWGRLWENQIGRASCRERV